MVELLRPKGINEGMTDVNLEQREIISIEGTLLMLDGKTPHIRVPVQAICEGQVIQATLSDYSGRYRFVNLSPGSYQLRCQVLGGYVYYRAIDHALRSTFYDSGTTESAMEDDLGDILRIQNGKTLANIDFHFAPFKKGTWRHHTPLDGLAHNDVHTMFIDPGGIIWFGTEGGVSRYDGKGYTNFSVRDGLVSNSVDAICRAHDGAIWFATRGGGVSCYNGNTFTSFTEEDGLSNNDVRAICCAPNGDLWFGTDHGLTRYRPNPSRPEVRVVSITTDQTYRDPLSLPALNIGQRVTIEYDSLDFKTVPEKRQYRYRIREIDADWRKPTRATSYDHVFDKEGDYTFEMQAIDRDLNYSEPAVLTLTVNPDPRLVSLQKEVNHLRREVGQKYHFDNIIGRSAVIRQVRALMERAIDSGLTVLITGETGTGKELVAKAIHYHSPRRDHPLLDRNCGAIPRELLASDLFGHRKGAFTGAAEDKAGLFEAASGGTVMLDEISEMPEDAQVHLLRVLQERKVQRLGEHISRDVDVRVIAMTNRNLVREVTDGRFREDLYYRLNEFPIHIPALRERAEDIPILAEHFLQEIDKEVDGFAPDVFEMLQSYPWPGNVRELRNEVHRACALVEEGARIQSYHFSPQVTRGESLIQNIISEKLSYSDSLDLFRRRLVDNALRACNGNRHEAAKMLGMARPNLVALIKRLGIK
jgi:DNA-binding NtrC family response regulator